MRAVFYARCRLWSSLISSAEANPSLRRVFRVDSIRVLCEISTICLRRSFTVPKVTLNSHIVVTLEWLLPVPFLVCWDKAGLQWNQTQICIRNSDKIYSTFQYKASNGGSIHFLYQMENVFSICFNFKFNEYKNPNPSLKFVVSPSCFYASMDCS